MDALGGDARRFVRYAAFCGVESAAAVVQGAAVAAVAAAAERAEL